MAGVLLELGVQSENVLFQIRKRKGKGKEKAQANCIREVICASFLQGWLGDFWSKVCNWRMSCSKNVCIREPIASDMLFIPRFFKDGSGIFGARFAIGECPVPK